MNKKVEAIRREFVNFWPVIQVLLFLITVFIVIVCGITHGIKVEKEARLAAFAEEFGSPYPTDNDGRANARSSVVAVLNRQREVTEKAKDDYKSFDKLVKDLPRTTVEEVDQYFRAKDQQEAMNEDVNRQQAYYEYLLSTAYSAGFEKETEAIAGYEGPVSICGCK